MQTREELESAKYSSIWSVSRYHDFSPGEQYAPIFAAQFEPDKSVTIIDAGCGAGAGGRALKDLGYTNVTFLDLVSVTKEAPFVQTALWDNWGTPLSDWVFCCDVLEHIPTEYVGLVLHRIRIQCAQAFLSIGLTDDAFGKVIRDELHLTVKPFDWWRDFLKEFGEVEDARDLGVTGMYHVKF